MRVAFIADTHEVPLDIDSQAFFPGYLRLLPEEKRRDAYHEFRYILRVCHLRVLREISLLDPHLLIHLGDMTCGYKERGISHASARTLVDLCLGMYVHITGCVRVCWSNHDAGYQGRKRIIEMESLMECRRFSPLFWKEEVGEMLFIGVCSPLLEEGSRHLKEVRELRAEQEEFVWKALNEKGDAKWVLCSHEPAIRPLRKVVSAFEPSLEREICGHRHIPGGRKRQVTCPSVAPIGWRGGGYLAGLAEESLSLWSRKVTYAPDLEKRLARFPFKTLPGALFWMGVGQFVR